MNKQARGRTNKWSGEMCKESKNRGLKHELLGEYMSTYKCS